METGREEIIVRTGVGGSEVREEDNYSPLSVRQRRL